VFGFDTLVLAGRLENCKAGYSGKKNMNTHGFEMNFQMNVQKY
jgi:hypothetical protein